MRRSDRGRDGRGRGGGRRSRPCRTNNPALRLTNGSARARRGQGRYLLLEWRSPEAGRRCGPWNIAEGWLAIRVGKPSERVTFQGDGPSRDGRPVLMVSPADTVKTAGRLTVSMPALSHPSRLCGAEPLGRVLFSCRPAHLAHSSLGLPMHRSKCPVHRRTSSLACAPPGSSRPVRRAAPPDAPADRPRPRRSRAGAATGERTAGADGGKQFAPRIHPQGVLACSRCRQRARPADVSRQSAFLSRSTARRRLMPGDLIYTMTSSTHVSTCSWRARRREIPDRIHAVCN